MELTKTIVLNNLKDELKRINKVSLDEQNDIERQDNEEHREPLSIDVTKEYKILLSWGGGEDGFKLRFDNENNLMSGVYYMADWGEYEEVELTSEEAEQVYDFYMYGDVSSM